MIGRIIAIRVSDTDFAKLEELKKGKYIGWNQLLLAPVETMYDVALETSHPKEKPAKEEKPAKAAKKKGGKAKAAVVEEAPTETARPEEPQVLEGEVIDPAETKSKANPVRHPHRH